MEYGVALEYYEAMLCIESEERTHLLGISAYPQTSKEDQSKTFKKYKNKVYTNEKGLDSDSLEKMLKIKGLM